MRIVACYKYVIDEQDIRVNPENRSLITDRAAWKISDFDKNAIEESVRIKEQHNAYVFALTAGANSAKASLTDALARGADEAVLIQDEALLNADPAITAKVLAQAVKKIGDCSLVICGDCASDDYAKQVGPRLGVLLGWPVITYVRKVEIAGNVVKAERNLDNGIEVVEVELPAVITVSSDINTPRIPSIKQLISAKKKPAHTWALNDIGVNPEQLATNIVNDSIKGTVVNRKHQIYKGDVKEAVSKLLDDLAKEGII